jgi:hypothetical protein
MPDRPYFTFIFTFCPAARSHGRQDSDSSTHRAL